MLKRRLDYGPSSIGFPNIPRGPRSVRRRISNKEDTGESKICAFELLAAVAVELLQESESSASSNALVDKDLFIGKLLKENDNRIGNEKLESCKALIPELPDRGSCAQSSRLSGTAVTRNNSKSLPFVTVPETESIVSASNISKTDGNKVKMENPDVRICIKQEDTSPKCRESSKGYVDNSIERQVEAKGNFKHNDDFIGTNTSTDKLDIHVNYYPLLNTDSSVQLTSFRDSIPNGYFRRCRNNVNVSTRDDDENFIRFNQCKPKIRALRPQLCTGYRRIRKLSASKYWKVAPKLKDCEFSNSERGMKRIFHNRNYFHSSQRIRQGDRFKKRKVYDGSLRHSSDQEGSSESISNTREKGIKEKKIGSAFKSRKVCGISTAPIVSQSPSYQSRDSHVRFSIKSFKVPELFIEVPVTATVGSLKRTVMEAVTAILQEGLGVGVLLQGEKVKDDERTLLQSGISQNGNLDNLGFSLEPTSVLAPPPVSPEVRTLTLLPCETNQQLTSSPMNESVAGPLVDLGITNPSADPLRVDELDNNIKTNLELVPFPTDVEAKALVPLPAISVEALAVVPVSPKVKKTEPAHRRIRRPFSVIEVEALVEAVETLGTGRWRDVKLRAFENADHRTYVDLKDKWKTLVHTASIAPQQRRGQPVPQELLDRVLCAHAYWSQHQSKQQHTKNQAELGTA